MDIERVHIFLLIPVRLHVAASALYGNENEGGPIVLGTFKTKNLSTKRMKSIPHLFLVRAHTWTHKHVKMQSIMAFYQMLEPVTLGMQIGRSGR